MDVGKGGKGAKEWPIFDCRLPMERRGQFLPIGHPIPGYLPHLKPPHDPSDTRLVRPPSNPVSFLSDAPKKQDNRIRGRLRVELLKCKLGDVQDLSGTGMRVRRRGRLMVKKGEIYEVTLASLVGKQTVKARVMWIKRAGFFRHEIGLKFEGLTPEVEKGITAIARISVDARFIYGDHRVGDIKT